jgi:hypothetical protein
VHSVSQKHRLFNCHVQPQRFGIQGRQTVAEVPSETCLPNEWLEAFWCRECQQTNWYCVKKIGALHTLSPIPPQLWQYTLGTAYPWGNPSVSEYSRRHARPPHCG